MKIKRQLRTVPTFVTAQTFYASRDTRVSYGDIFARFKTMKRKQNLASALGIQKRKGGGGGVTMHFSEII